jgi:DNA replication protein DnaC
MTSPTSPKTRPKPACFLSSSAPRYERRSLLITANQPFGEWGKIFPDQAMTVAVVDRLVHHATIFEMNVESYRRRAALERKRSRGRPPTHATITANA